MSKIDKPSVLKALSKVWRSADIKKLSSIKRFNDISISMLFSWYKYNKELVIQHMVREMGKTRRGANISIKTFMDKCEEVGINLSEIDKDKEIRKKNPPKKKKGDVEKAISKLSPVLDLFNINKKATLTLLEEIEKGNDLSQEEMIKTYKVLYSLLMSKAKGETVTRKTSVSYELVEQKDGTFKKQIVKRPLDGKQMLYEETQSHLPDERAFAGALVVMEVIQNLEGGNTEFLTQEEKEDRYENYLLSIKQEQTIFGDKEYTEAELEDTEGVDK